MRHKIPNRLKEALSYLSSSVVAIGFSSIEISPLQQLDALQEGYSGANWQKGWLVIGHEGLAGDPIFVDLGEKQIPVFTAAHDTGSWSPVCLAESIEGFCAIVEKLRKLARNRSNPVELEANPLGEKEVDRFLSDVAKSNPQADFEVWRSWMS